MGYCPTTSDEQSTQAGSATLAHALAPEEIRAGDFVTPLYELSEWPSWLWCDNSLHNREQPVRICTMPHSEPQPLKVCAACLPFVLVKTPAGQRRTLDVRKCRLARLDRSFARPAWKFYRRAAKRAARGL